MLIAIRTNLFNPSALPNIDMSLASPRSRTSMFYTGLNEKGKQQKHPNKLLLLKNQTDNRQIEV